MSSDRFPGWRVVTGCFIVLSTSSGLGFYGLAVYLNAFSRERGWDVASVSLATTLFFFVGGIVGVWTARLVARHDVRVVIVGGSVLGGATLAILGQVEHRWQLFVVYGVYAVGWSGAGMVPATTVIARWFHRRPIGCAVRGIDRALRRRHPAHPGGEVAAQRGRDWVGARRGWAWCSCSVRRRSRCGSSGPIR